MSIGFRMLSTSKDGLCTSTLGDSGNKSHMETKELVHEESASPQNKL